MKRWPLHLWLSFIAVLFAIAVNVRACLRSDPTPDQPPAGARQ